MTGKVYQCHLHSFFVLLHCRLFTLALIWHCRQQQDRYDYAGRSGELPLADAETCHLHAEADSEGLQISRACLELPPLEDWGNNCFHYPEFSAEICYVRAEKVVVDNRNVVFWNSLKPEDILFLNSGLHHNTR